MIESILWLPDVLSSAACDALLVERMDWPWDTAKIGTGGDDTAIVPETRTSEIQWLDRAHWLTALLWQTLNRVNSEAFGFEIRDHEAVQLTKYEAGGHYQWHQDLFYPPPGSADLPRANWTIRKLSISLQLSPPDAYTDGTFIYRTGVGRERNGAETGELWDAQGSALIFPSTLYHRVQPVSAGTRISAVLWATGSVWR